MAEIKWIKITTNIFDDEKIKLIDAMPDADAIIVIWFKLLTQAGKINQDGALMLSQKLAYTDEMLATIFNRKIATIRLALETFDALNMIERGDYIQITNWEKHQNIEGMEKIRLQNKKRQKVFRERKKQEVLTDNVSVTLHNAIDIDKELELDKEQDKEKELKTSVEVVESYENYFNLFWKTYPKKVGKEKCYNWFRARKISEEFFIKIIKAIENQKQSQQWLKDKGQFIPNPYTWLNRGGWDDELKTKENWESWVNE